MPSIVLATFVYSYLDLVTQQHAVLILIQNLEHRFSELRPTHSLRCLLIKPIVCSLGA